MTIDEIYETWVVPGEGHGPAGMRTKAFIMDRDAEGLSLVSSTSMDSHIFLRAGCRAELEVYSDLSILLKGDHFNSKNRPITGHLPDTMDELLNWVAMATRMYWE